MMKTLLIALMLAAPARPASAGAFPLPVHEQTLPNGLKVVLVPFDSPGLVAYYTLVRVGSRNEVEPGHSGFAHLFEHMMFRGTEKYAAFDAEMARIGWHNNAWTSNDETVYTDFGPTDGLPKVVELEADRFRNLEYTEAVFRTETGAVLGEYNKSASQPWLQLEEKLHGTAFEKHTYRHTTLGFLEDIRAMPEKYDYSVRFLERFYTPDNTVVFVVGDFDREKTLALIQEHYGAWQGVGEVSKVEAEPEQTAERRAKIDWPQATLPRLLIGYKVPPASDVQATAAQDVLFAYLLGETSPLHKDLVLDRQIAEPFAPWTRPGRDPSLWAFLATGKSDDALPEIEAAFDAALAEIAAGKVDADRLAQIKSNRRYGLLLGLDDAEKVASALAVYTSPTGDVGALDRFMAALDALTAEDLTAFARTYVVPQKRTVVTLTGPAAAKGGAQ